MAQTYEDGLKLSLITPGTESGTWGGITNNNIKQIVKGMGGYKSVTVSGTSATISTSDDVSQDLDFRQLYLNITGSSSGAFTLNLPAIQKVYIVKNGINHAMTVKLTGESGSGVTIAQGKVGIVYLTGTNAVAAFDSFPAANLTGTIPVASGGTGLTSVTSGAVLIGNGTGALTVRAGGSTNDVLTWNGSTWVSQAPAAGSGTVTSVSGSGTVDGITLSGSFTTSGTLTLGGGISGVVKTTGSSTQTIESPLLSTAGSGQYYMGSTSYAIGQSGGSVSISASGIGYQLSSSYNLFTRTLVSQSSPVDLGLNNSNNAFGSLYYTGSLTAVSDQREKNNIADSDLGLSFINALTPRKYTKKFGASVFQKLDENNIPEYSIKTGSRPHYGLVAQEVKQVMTDQSISDFGGWKIQDTTDANSTQFLAYEEFISPMIKAIQELSAKVTTLEAKVKELESK
jgi:hypothetical protein